MINVFLDDVRPCPKGFVSARTAEECQLLLAECEINILSLDYELGYDQLNGMAVVHQLIAGGKYPREIFIHSSSSKGRAEMAYALRCAQLPGVIVHDGPMSEADLQAAAGDAHV